MVFGPLLVRVLVILAILLSLLSKIQELEIVLLV